MPPLVDTGQADDSPDPDNGQLTSSATLLALATFLVATHLGGVLARRVGRPAVIGQLASGVLLGPTVLAPTSSRLLDHEATSTAKWLGTIGLVAFVLGATLERAHLPVTRRFVLDAAAVFGTSPALRILERSSRRAEAPTYSTT